MGKQEDKESSDCPSTSENSIRASTDSVSLNKKRNSNNFDVINIQNARASLQNMVRKSEVQKEDETDASKWRFSYLKKLFESLEIQDLFKMYVTKLRHGFFSLFLIFQPFVIIPHLSILLSYNKESLIEIAPDVVVYGAIAVLSFTTLVLTDGLSLTNRKYFLQILSLLAYGILMFTNAFVPLFHYSDDHNKKFRPAYTWQIIIACYVFLFIPQMWLSVVMGILATGLHILVTVLVTYDGNSMLWQRIVSDFLFLFCLNVLGLYYRYMNEIIRRKSFLDKRACVISSIQLDCEEKHEQQLMQSIIPEHIIDVVKNHISEAWNKLDHHQDISQMDKQTFLKQSDNVSILFADIVNYTEMTSKLKIDTLLETLNELFVSFDDASEELKVLRIKFLGDCYYCVAGILPDPTLNHAEACVDLGLKMIGIIADVRRKKDLNINMRIGVHSGTVLGGLVGKHKWQYDIWSTDVDIANRMETEGSAGKVHITSTTKNLLLKRYNIVTTDKGETVPLFKEYGLSTYLISPEELAEAKKDKVSFQNGHVIIENERNHISKPISQDYNNSNSVVYLSLINDTTFDEDETNLDVINENNVHPPSPPPPRRITKYRKNTTTRRTTLSLPPSKVVPEANFITENFEEERTSRHSSRQNRRKVTPSDAKRRTAFMNHNIKRLEESLRNTHQKMQEFIEKLSLSKYNQWFENSEINPLFLFFKTWGNEVKFFKTVDPLFKYYLISEMVLLVFLFFLQNLTKSQWDWNTWPTYIAFAITALVLVPITWIYDIWNTHFKTITTTETQLSKMMYFFKKTSNLIVSNVFCRLIIYYVVCILFALSVFTEMFQCTNYYLNKKQEVVKKSFFILLFKEETKENIYYSECIIPWHMTETCALAIVMNFLFLRLYLWIKILTAAIITTLYSFCVWTYSGEFYEASETYNYNLPPKAAHVFSIVVLTLILHFVDRQKEYMSRMDHLWNENLQNELNSIEKLRMINRLLLDNILPKHVADMYLDMSRPPIGLYHEKYNDVAVMFATIVNVPTDISNELKMDIMNAAISDFDKLLMQQDFIDTLTDSDEEDIIRPHLQEDHTCRKKSSKTRRSKMLSLFRPKQSDSAFEENENGIYQFKPEVTIEKIKVAKWTYMAACGLSPGLGQDISPDDVAAEQVIRLVKFAAKMKLRLHKIGRETFQPGMDLRVGISNGEIVAGVVGAKKPLYDIWGDPVNMASRMDTTGEAGCIQVLEHTAKIIQGEGFQCEYRGQIHVKGKDKPLPTYYVKLDKKYNLVPIDR